MIRIFLTFALLASAITTNKLLLWQFSPIFFVGIRMFIAGAILLLLNLVQQKKLTLSDLYEQRVPLFLITLCTTYLPAICKSFALKYLPSSQAAFFGTLDPFITALMSYFLFNEKLSHRQFAGILLAMIGSFLMISMGRLNYEISNPWLIHLLLGLIALLAVTIGRYGWILVQKLLRYHSYSPLQINGVTMLASGILSLITAYFFEGITVQITSPFQTTLLLAYTIIIGNVIALTSYASLLKAHSATFLSLAGFSVPLFVALYGWLFLGEPLTMPFFIALFFTFAGLIIFSYRPRNSIRVI